MLADDCPIVVDCGYKLGRIPTDKGSEIVVAQAASCKCLDCTWDSSAIRWVEVGTNVVVDVQTYILESCRLLRCDRESCCINIL